MGRGQHIEQSNCDGHRGTVKASCRERAGVTRHEYIPAGSTAASLRPTVTPARSRQEADSTGETDPTGKCHENENPLRVKRVNTP
jgi:hypothetical protein